MLTSLRVIIICRGQLPLPDPRDVAGCYLREAETTTYLDNIELLLGGLKRAFFYKSDYWIEND